MYWTPSRLFRLGLKDNPNCWNCEIERGDLVHSLWACPNILGFWCGIHEFIWRITGSDFEFCPQLFILGDPSVLKHISKPTAEWIQTAIMIGRQIIMRHWKSPDGPTFSEWLIELGRVAAYEKISLSLDERVDKYESKWGKYLEFKSW